MYLTLPKFMHKCLVLVIINNYTKLNTGKIPTNEFHTTLKQIYKLKELHLQFCSSLLYYKIYSSKNFFQCELRDCSQAFLHVDLCILLPLVCWLAPQSNWTTWHSNLLNDCSQTWDFAFESFILQFACLSASEPLSSSSSFSKAPSESSKWLLTTS